MKIKVEFDNEDNGAEIELDAGDLTIRNVGKVYRPESVTDGNIAVYDVPDDLDLDEFIDALYQSSWCFRGVEQVPNADSGPEIA